MNEINVPWKDAEGRFNVLVQLESFDSIVSLHSRAQRFIAFTGVTNDRWPDVPIALYDRPEEDLYHYREEES